MENTITNNTDLVVEDVLVTLLDEGTASDLAELELDPASMPGAKASIITAVIHC